MNSPPEEYRISLLDNFHRQVRKRGFRPSCEDVGCVVSVAVLIAVAIFIVLDFNNDEKKLTSYKPEIRLDSIIVCSTNTSDNLMIWDLKFNITNPNNYSAVYTWFEVSIFSYNQTKLLTKAAEIGIYVGPKNHTTGIAYASASLQDPNSLDRSNGTIHFDLKIHPVFLFRYLSADDVYHSGDVVCGDAKVALLPSSNKLSCGSLVGDPFACSYQRYYKKSFWEYYFGH